MKRQVKTLFPRVLALSLVMLIYSTSAMGITILVEFDGRKDKVTFKREIVEKGKKKSITVTKEVPKSDVTAEERKKFFEKMNGRFKDTGVTFIDDPTKPHDATLDITSSKPPKEIGGTQFGTTDLERKGAWVFEDQIKSVKHGTGEGGELKRGELINALINIADHEAGHIAGLGHSDKGLMRAGGKWDWKTEGIDESFPPLDDADKKKLSENKDKKDFQPAGTETKHDMMVFLGIPDVLPEEEFDDFIDMRFNLIPNDVDNPSNPFNTSFALGYLNAGQEFIFMMDGSDILNGDDAFAFLGGDRLALSLRDTSGSLFNALTGHALLPTFSNLIGPALFTDANMGFDLNFDGILDVTTLVHVEDEPGCGTGCNGLMPVPEPPTIMLLGIGALGLGLLRRQKLSRHHGGTFLPSIVGRG